MAETKSKQKTEKPVKEEEQDERSFFQKVVDFFRRIPKGAIIEIVLLAIELLNTLLPLPYRLIVPIVFSIRLMVLKYRDKPQLLKIVLFESIFITARIIADFYLPIEWRIPVLFITGARSILHRYRHRHKGDNKDCYCDAPDSIKPKKKDSKNAKEKQ